MKLEFTEEGLTLEAEGQLEESYIKNTLDISNHRDGVLLFKNVYNDKTKNHCPTILKADERYTLKKIVKIIDIRLRLKRYINYTITSAGLNCDDNRTINKLARQILDELIKQDLLDLDQVGNELIAKLKVFNKNI